MEELQTRLTALGYEIINCETRNGYLNFTVVIDDISMVYDVHPSWLSFTDEEIKRDFNISLAGVKERNKTDGTL